MTLTLVLALFAFALLGLLLGVALVIVSLGAYLLYRAGQRLATTADSAAQSSHEALTACSESHAAVTRALRDTLTRINPEQITQASFSAARSAASLSRTVEALNKLVYAPGQEPALADLVRDLQPGTSASPAINPMTGKPYYDDGLQPAVPSQDDWHVAQLYAEGKMSAPDYQRYVESRKQQAQAAAAGPNWQGMAQNPLPDIGDGWAAQEEEEAMLSESAREGIVG